MDHKDCFFVGKIIKKFSFKGVLLVKLDTDEPEEYTKMESVFVDLNGTLVPFFIEELALHKTELLRVQFEDVYDEQTADSLIGCDLYLPLDFLPKLTGNKFYYHEIIGFTVVDRQRGNIGTIMSVNDHSRPSGSLNSPSVSQAQPPNGSALLGRLSTDSTTNSTRTVSPWS